MRAYTPSNVYFWIVGDVAGEESKNYTASIFICNVNRTKVLNHFPLLLGIYKKISITITVILDLLLITESVMGGWSPSCP
jgi:hypothetical protein